MKASNPKIPREPKKPIARAANNDAAALRSMLRSIVNATREVIARPGVK